MDLVHDDSRERILGTGHRTSLETLQLQPLLQPLADLLADAAMDSLVRVSDGASSDTMDWDYSETSNFATRAMFGSWFVIDQVPDMELMTVAMHSDSEQFESLGDIPSDVLPPGLCRLCDRRFSRLQELRRHISQVHSPPRQCPFCRYQWKRPHKIKDHLLKVHCDELSPETLNGISALNGRGLVEFLDTSEHLPYDVIPLAGGSSTPLSKSLPTNDQSPGTDSDKTVLPAELKSLDIADRAPPCDMDFVRDDDLERILRTGDRTGVMSSPSSSSWPPTNDKSLRTSTEHQTVAMPSLGLKDLAGTASDVDHLCQACGMRFRRLQELRRHISQVHSPPRQCLFCRYQWKRPHKIKDHLLKVHCNELSPETLKGISALNGRGLVEFLDTSEHLPHDVIPLAGGSSTPLSKSLPTNDQSPGTDSDITVLPAELKSLGPSSSSWPTNDKSLRTSTEHQTVAMPSFGLKGLDDVCQACGMRFRRLQELRRHEIDVHSPPRQCLFCRYQWKRPHKIKDHLLKIHCDELSPETLEGISALNGRGLVEFLDTSEHLSHDVMPPAGGSSTPTLPDMPQTPPATPRATSPHSPARLSPERASRLSLD